MKELMISLTSGAGTPMYEQIYLYIKEEIRNGRIKIKEQLPSVRALSNCLSVSRSTVDMAYLQLQSEGYIDSLPRKGYFVADIGLLQSKLDMLEKNNTDKENKIDEVKIDFSPRGINLEYFPYNIWRKISKKVLSVNEEELFKPSDAKGDWGFRQTIAKYLFESRGVRTDADSIILGAGNEYLLMLLERIISCDGVIAMENPTYTQALRVFESLGRKIIPVDMDDHGLRLDCLKNASANIVYVMPSHQYPMGTVMPVGRRLALLQWSSDGADRYIIEDDYDSEFRYKGKPIPALKSLDREDRVIYIGTFSRSISPALRMSYMVLPAKLMQVYQNNLSFYASSVSVLDQAIVNEFIISGQFERHLNRMRSIYRNRHDLLINGLKLISCPMKIYGENAGLHIRLEVRLPFLEKKVINDLLKEGVRVYGLSEFFFKGNEYIKTCSLILGYANLSEDEIRNGIAIIKKVLESAP